MKERNRTWYQLSIVVTLVFILFFSSIFLVEKTGQHILGAVTYASGTNATVVLYDDGDSLKTAAAVVPDIEINNLFTGTSNVYFYANYTNGTGQSMFGVSGTACAIEFEAGAAGQTGPFAMITNATLNVWEYNRSFANNGTFIWNVTCSNADAGTAAVRAYDTVRIFGPGCQGLENILPNLITNNTIMCGGVESAAPALSKSVFSIRNNNLTLDCNFTIFRGANAEVGIDIGPYNGTIIKNCLFENYTKAINNSFVGLNTVLLFNNSFANLTVNALNLGNIMNLTLHSNNFTNSTASAVIIENITNATITQNYFCNNGIPTIYDISANYTATNNTFCVNLVSPLNNTVNGDINYTFVVPSVGYQRTCNLLINNVNNSGTVKVSADNETAKNVTVNTTFYAANKFVWQVNCTDTNDNKGISVSYNSTYGACTIPTNGATIGPSNITLCPGTYYLNDSAIAINGRAGGIICNNTILKGNNSASAVNIVSVASDARVVGCDIAGFSKAIEAEAVLTNRLVIINNTFTNMSYRTLSIKLHAGDNITNNSFRDVDTAIFMQNTYNHTLENNFIYNASVGMRLRNATGTSIVNNNLTNITTNGLNIDTFTPLANITSFNYTVSNNYFCGIANNALLIQDYQMSSTLNGIASSGANTFCNSTDSTPNSAIAKVTWTTAGYVFNNAGPIDASDVSVKNRLSAVQSIETTNATGDISVALTEFNLSTNNVLTYTTPHQFIANASGSTKTVSFLVNESRTVEIGNQVRLNLSNPDALPNIPDHAKAAALRSARASAAAAQAAVEPQEDENDEEEEEEVIIEQINYTYVLLLKEIIFDNEIVYSQTTEAMPLVFKDYESYNVVFIVENNGTGNLTNFVYSLDVPNSITIVSSSIDKEVLQEGETAKVTFRIESQDIQEAFNIKFHLSATPNISLQATMRTMLEEGKGELYSTKQKIIEETQAIITKTYEILFLLFLIPLLLLLRATTIADEKALRQMIDDKKVSKYWKIYVPEDAYMKYNAFQNLRPIELEDADIAKANHLAAEKKVSYQLATTIVFAQQCLIPRIFTFEQLSPELRHQYPRVHFTSPLRDYKEDQLQRYIEKQQSKGFTNNEIRETLLAAKWKKEIIKKYLAPENDLKLYVEEQKKKGKTLGELRKELLDVKWDKTVVDAVIPREEVMKEYVTVQRRQGKTNPEIKAQLFKAGWEKDIVEKHLNAENDLKAYITLQQHRGFTCEQITAELISKGWKKEVLEKHFSVK